MFLAYKEIIHNKARYLLVMATFVLIAYLVFFLTGLATGLARNNRTAIDALPVITFSCQNMPTRIS